jgi:adenosylmethionine-8-amino-7-oxononanoate aminotransferase
MNYYNLGSQHIWLPYTQMQNHLKQLEVENALGSKIYLKNRQVLIDGIASWWSVAHGYNHPYLVKEMLNQAQHLSHIMLAGLAMESTYKLAYRLSEFCGLDRVFFSDSGSTAIEVAMKIAWQYHININQKNKTKFIAFKNSYHGDTTGAMSLADLSSGMHQKFKNLLLENFSLDFPRDLNQLDEFSNFLKKNNQQIAGIFIEPMVQCAGGMHIQNDKILQEIFKIAKDNKILIIADECATGFYRTGKKFAYQFTDLMPDILCVGKALTAGMLTLSATLTTAEIYQSFLSESLDKALMHGPTFMGNALACSVANASLDLFEQEDYALKVSNIERILKIEFAKFKKFKRVIEINVIGAIGVVRIDLNWQETLNLRQRFIELGVFIRPFANTIYLMPALTINNQELLLLTNKISQVLTEISN